MTDDSNSDSQTVAGASFDAAVARTAVGAYDDAQQVRTAMMNRVRDIVRKKNEDIPFDAVEEEKDPDDRDYESKYNDENLPDIIEEMYEEGTLSDHEHNYLAQMLEAGQAAAAVEERYKAVMSITEREPIFTEWLQHVNGISTTLTAKLIHRFGYCEEREKVSQIWAYSGLAPGQERTRGEKLNFDPQAKTLAWLCADRIIMQGDRSRYKTEFYDPYKAEQIARMNASECQFCGKTTETHNEGSGDRACEEYRQATGDDDQFADFGLHFFELPEEFNQDASPPWSRGHADARARRYLAKKFLKHYWYIARDVQGLDTPDEWIVTHGGHDKREDTFENPAYAKRELMSP